MPDVLRYVFDKPLALLAAACLLAGGCATPKPASAPEAIPSGLITRSYSTAEIARLLKAHENANPTHRRPAPPSTQPVNLADAVKQRIEPTSWREFGGRGSAESTADQVVITQSPELHQRIQNMIRFADSRIELELLLTENLAALAEWERSHPPRWLHQGSAQIWPDPLTAEQFEQFLNNQDLVPDGSRMGVSKLTLFNGQRISHFTGEETAYVSDLTPIVGTNAVAFDPQVSIAYSGLSLSCGAEIAGDGKTVILNLRPRLSQLRELAPPAVSATGGPLGTVEAYLQLPRSSVAEFERTVRVPSGGTILLKTPLLQTPPPQILTPPKTLVILVRASIIIPEIHP